MQPIRVAAEEGFFEKMINSFLALLGLKKRRKMKSIIAVHGAHAQMPIDRARPMTESRMKKGGKKKEQRAPQSEGLIVKAKKTRKKKAKPKKGVSFPEYKEEEPKKKGKKKKKSEGENPFRSYKKK
jgi:hypothetical protein